MSQELNVIADNLQFTLETWPSYRRNPPFERPPLLLEYLPNRPYFVLQEVFSTLTRCEILQESLSDWLNSPDFNFSSQQEGNENLRFLRRFYNDLRNLIGALHEFLEYSRRHNYKLVPFTSVKRNPGANPIDEEISCSREIIYRFCERYHQLYVRRELWCFFNALLLHSFNNPQTSQPAMVLSWFEDVLALTEAAYVFYKD